MNEARSPESPSATTIRGRFRTVHGRHRSAFTLVELLVVMLIISILAAILLPAVIGSFGKAKVAQGINEITQLGAALEAFKNQYGTYPPSRIRLREGSVYRAQAGGSSVPDPFDQMSVEWLQRIFGPNLGITVAVNNGSEVTITSGSPATQQWLIWCQDDPSETEVNRVSRSGYTPQIYELEGDQCLAFFLGGIASMRDSTGAVVNTSSTTPTNIVFQGFAKNPVVPATIIDANSPATLTRNGPFYEFAVNRLYLRSKEGTLPTRAAADWNREFPNVPNSGSNFNYQATTNGLFMPSYRPINKTDGGPIAYFSSYNGRGYRPDDMSFQSIGGTVETGVVFQILWPVITSTSGTFPYGTASPGPNPYTETVPAPVGTAASQSVLKAFKSDTYQLISPGADGLFGAGGQLGVTNMTGRDAGTDNLTNLAGSTIGDYNARLMAK